MRLHQKSYQESTKLQDRNTNMTVRKQERHGKHEGPAPSQTAGFRRGWFVAAVLIIGVGGLGTAAWAGEAETAPATMAATVPAATGPATVPATMATSLPATMAATMPSLPVVPEAGGGSGSVSGGYGGRFGRGGVGGGSGGSSRGLPVEYDILNKKSIFSKDRSRRSDYADRRPRMDVPVRVVHAPVFKGAVLEDAGFAGFVENLDTGEMLVVRVGDALPNGAGTVADLTLDYMDISGNGAAAGTVTKRINVGEDFSGAAPTAVTTVAPVATTEGSGGSGGTAGPASTAPAATGGAVDDVAERMRRRRQQQLGG